MAEKSHSNPGRIPPQDIAAEKSLLGAILISDNDEVFSDIITIIQPHDFYDKNHQTIFEAMLNLYNRHQPIDTLTMNDELKSLKKLKEIGGAAYLAELSNFVPTASHAKAYANIIEKASVRRKLISAGEVISDRAYEDDSNIQELIGNAEQELFKVSNKLIKNDYVPIEELLADAYERIEELHKNKGALRGLKSGFRDLDNKTAGFQKGDLVIIGARPAMGKTTFAQNIAYNIAKYNNKGVLFFSMEMA